MIRRDNLKLLLKQNNWTNADLARVLKKSDAYVAKLLRPGESFGEKTARNIEHEAKKPRGWLDQVHLAGDYSEGHAEQAPKAMEGMPPYLVAPVSDSLIPVITWEKLYMLGLDNNSRELEDCERAPSEGAVGSADKWVVMPDDSMAGVFPRNAKLKVSTDLATVPPLPGRYVLVQDKSTAYCIRRYKAISANHFLAEPQNPGYATLDSQRDGLRVIAVVYQALIDF